MAAEDRKFNSNANRYYTVGSAAYKTDVAPQYEPRVLPKKPAATPSLQESHGLSAFLSRIMQGEHLPFSLCSL